MIDTILYNGIKSDKFEIANAIIENMLVNNKNEIVIVNVGSDKVIYDCFGPLLGTLIEESNLNITSYGTMKDPIHALNIDTKLDEISKNHSNALIIGTDACFSDHNDPCGILKLRDLGIRPGAGVGKTLPTVGTMSIVMISERVIKLNTIYESAKFMVDVFDTLEKLYELSMNKAM